jgi:hypothetical protein
LEETAIESLDAQVEIMRSAKAECLDPMDPDRRWEAGRLAVASAQDILNRTAPKPQVGQVEHNHRHLHLTVPTGLLDAVKALSPDGESQSSDIIDVSEPTASPDGMPLVVEDDGDDERQSGT